MYWRIITKPNPRWFYRLQKKFVRRCNNVEFSKLNLELETYSDPDEWIIDPRPLTYSIKEFF
jgi:hypothetical protein